VDDELSALVMRSKHRDAAAFTQLIRRCERAALSIAYAHLGDATAAGDVVQEALFRAWRRIADLENPSRFPAWLCSIVRNVAIEHRRKLKRFDPSVDPPREPAWIASDPGAGLERAERCRQVDAALQSLDDVSRSAVVLRYYENLSSREIGELLGISATAVDMRLSRARQDLRERLAALMPEPAQRI
jgi:RNA polymerase sigma-70 factor (ECF subfamily)